MVETEGKPTMNTPMTVARVRVPDDVWHEVKVAAAQRRQSIQEYVADALRTATSKKSPGQTTSQMAG